MFIVINVAFNEKCVLKCMRNQCNSLLKAGRCDHVVFAEASGSFSLAAVLVKHWLGNLCYTRSGDFEQILIYDKSQF